MELILFCGLQASGKSTFYRERFSATHLLISKDLISSSRKERRQEQLLHLALQANHSVVIDNTNPMPAQRVPLIEIARSYNATVAGYYFVTPVKQALERNQQREGKARVPPVAIYSTATRLIPPTYAEGFDKIYCVRIAEDSTKDIPAWKIEEIDHG
jgi:predicted kinase